MKEQLPIRVVYHTRLDNIRFIYLERDQERIRLPLSGQTNATLLALAHRLADMFGTKVVMTREVITIVEDDDLDIKEEENVTRSKNY